MNITREELQRYKAYLRQFIEHMTPTKLVNFFQVELALRKNKISGKNFFPYYLIVDLWGKCNLKCPICLTGAGRTLNRANTINFTNYVKTIEPLKDYLFFVALYNWGEPFFNKDIYKIIEWNKSNNIGSIVSSNLNVEIDHNRLITSGLDYLSISADGITQKTYEKYRVNGSLNKVLQNLEAIITTKNKLKSRKPFIEWQCLVNRFNEFELKEIKEIAYDYGVNLVRFCNLNFWGFPDELKRKWLPENKSYRIYEKDYSSSKRVQCYWLWRSMVVNSDLSISPCCLYDIKGWANAANEPLVNIWRSDIYKNARSLSLKKQNYNSRGIICYQCKAPWIFKN